MNVCFVVVSLSALEQQTPASKSGNLKRTYLMEPLTQIELQAIDEGLQITATGGILI